VKVLANQRTLAAMRCARTLGTTALVAVVAITCSTVARADQPLADPYELPDAPRSFALPELTHPDIEWTATTSLGAVGSPRRTGPEGLEEIGVEVPIASRRWFAGMTYEVAEGPPITAPGDSSIVGGNLELYGRTVWATRTGLAFGGGFGVIPPIATFTRDAGGGDTALAAISMQPWDYSFFRVGALTLRPFIDVRDLFGRFVVQFRMALDWSVQMHDASDSDVSATASVYFGFIATPILGLGLEATEFYRIDALIPDDQRANVLVTPSVRLLTSGIQPALGAFVGIGSPLDASATSVWGVRLALTFVWDPRRPFFHAFDFLK
jgi:hypothetical protein